VGHFYRFFLWRSTARAILRVVFCYALLREAFPWPISTMQHCAKLFYRCFSLRSTARNKYPYETARFIGLAANYPNFMFKIMRGKGTGHLYFG
jgi:hypothetical protein